MQLYHRATQDGRFSDNQHDTKSLRGQAELMSYGDEGLLSRPAFGVSMCCSELGQSLKALQEHLTKANGLLGKDVFSRPLGPLMDRAVVGAMTIL